jgi:hypothetical protein
MRVFSKEPDMVKALIGLDAKGQYCGALWTNQYNGYVEDDYDEAYEVIIVQ